MDILQSLSLFILGMLFSVAVYDLRAADAEDFSARFEEMGWEVVERQVPIVAVTPGEGEGMMGNMTVKLIPGTSEVLVDTNPFIEPDLQYSANIAVLLASEITHLQDIDRDFIFTYNIPSTVVGGGSAGAAATVATIAALEDKRLREDVAITGSVNPDGTIGQVGGILEKAQAVAEAGFTTFLIPDGQAKVTYYERERSGEEVAGMMFYHMEYVSKEVDLVEEAKELWGLEVIEVSDVKEAAEIMLE